MRGWDAERDTCPPQAPRGLGDLREAGSCAGEGWREDNEARHHVIRLARHAGYLVRHAWPREPVPCPECATGRRKRAAGWCVPCRGTGQAHQTIGLHRIPLVRYVAGPAQGCQAVDPWAIARTLHACARSWYLQLQITPPAGEGSSEALAITGAPMLCSRGHWCPVCAPRVSRELARALRAVVPTDAIQDGALVMATLTHRDHPDESLADALARWRRAWELVTRGRIGAELKKLILGTYYGLEATRGAQGKRGALGKWWHVHAHVIVWGQPLMDMEAVRRWFLDRWARATATAAEEAGLPGYGWDPVSGEDLAHDLRTRADGGRWCARCRRGEARCALEPCARWWAPIHDEAEIFQAAKYPTPLVDLHPLALAEFVAAAHGRRWHQGTGLLRSVRAWAEMYDPGAAPEEGRRISSAVPGEAPAVAEVVPELGRMRRAPAPVAGWTTTAPPILHLADDPKPDPAGQGMAVWRLVEDGTEIREAIVRAGGRISEALDANGDEWRGAPGPRVILGRADAAALALETARKQRERRSDLEQERAKARGDHTYDHASMGPARDSPAHDSLSRKSG